MTKNDKNVNVCKYMSECTDDLSLHGCCCYNVTGYLAAGCVVNVAGYLAAGCVAILHFTAAMVRRFLRA